MPSVFTRFTEIISSNINSILDKAENPAKMLKLMLGEMEDTLVEIKAACAQTMAEQINQEKRLNQVRETRDLWYSRASQAASKNRDDLARSALLEKRKADEALSSLTEEASDLSKLLAKYHTEIDQLESKIAQARERQTLMGLRKERAEQSLKASGQMKRYDLAAAQLRLTKLDQRLDRLEAEADLEQTHRSQSRSGQVPELEEEFKKLDNSLELELLALKESLPKE